MSARMLDLLLRQWPGKVALSPEEVAIVLGKQPETVREKMRQGTLPGATKRGGRWQMPLPDLAEVLEPTPAAPAPALPPRQASGLSPSRRRRAIVMNYRTDMFWAQVARAFGRARHGRAVGGAG